MWRRPRNRNDQLVDAEAYKPEYDYLFKLLLIGDSGVGKRELLRRFADQAYGPDAHSDTLGIDFKIRTVELHDKVIKLQMFYTENQQRFRTITTTYVKRSHGIIVVYDITQMDTFHSANSWLREIERHADPGVVLMLVGNNAHLQHQREVDTYIAEELAGAHNALFLEVDKDGQKVSNALMALAEGAILKCTRVPDVAKKRKSASCRYAVQVACPSTLHPLRCGMYAGILLSATPLAWALLQAEALAMAENCFAWAMLRDTMQLRPRQVSWSFIHYFCLELPSSLFERIVREAYPTRPTAVCHWIDGSIVERKLMELMEGQQAGATPPTLCRDTEPAKLPESQLGKKLVNRQREQKKWCLIS